MSKKSADKTVATAPDTAPTAGTGTLTRSDWFDRWPELFARHWPETFLNMPFGMTFGDVFRMEHLTDEDGAMLVRAELPGIDPAEDVTISIDDGCLTISGERREHTESDTHGYHSEFRYGSFSRSIRLPVGAQADDVVATYRDGILEVRVPVDADATTVRHVTITS